MSEEININPHLIQINVYQGSNDIAWLYEMTIAEDGARLAYIAGSYVTWMTGRVEWTPNDIDVFCVSRAAFDEMETRLRRNLVVYSEATEVALRLTLERSLLNINLIKPHPDWKQYPDDIINSFDLSVSRALLRTKISILADEWCGRTMCKILLINSPLRTLERVLKYSARGHVFTQWELLKLFRAWDAIADKEAVIASAREAWLTGAQEYEEAEAADEEYESWHEDDYWDGE